MSDAVENFPISAGEKLWTFLKMLLRKLRENVAKFLHPSHKKAGAALKACPRF